MMGTEKSRAPVGELNEDKNPILGTNLKEGKNEQHTRCKNQFFLRINKPIHGGHRPPCLI
jgi:hypothetical protein